MRLVQRLLELPFISVIRGRRGERLVRHYFVLSALLIGGGLITSGLLDIYFLYQDSLEHIAVLQQEVASGAAFKIQRFIQEIENALKAATKSRDVVLKGLSPEYIFELEKLLLIAPAVTEAVALDNQGIVRVQASRLHMAHSEVERDLSSSGSFQEAKQGKSYFSPVYYVRGSEPYMTIAVPIERFAGEVIGVLQAEVNLKYIWDVVSGIHVGKAGYAYAVSRSGDLIAHPDIGLVLQQRNLAHLEQVKSAFQQSANHSKQSALSAYNLQGQKVFSSYAVIPRLDWAIFTERPVEEAYQPLYASILRTSSLLLIGIGVALMASLLVARRVVRPLRTLRQGVERIGSGDLSHRVVLKTGDEIEILADQFNKMTAALQEAYVGLEQKVGERTRELAVANQQLDEASRHKSQFLANVSHELRTPMNAIIGFTRLVLRKTEGQIPELQKENLRKVLISAEHLLQLINGLLDLAKIEAGRMEVWVESFRLAEVIESAALTVEPMLKDGEVRLVRDIPSDLPLLNTDQEKLHQIILNLLSNAAKFTENGEIKVSAARENGWVRVEVADTGIGIARDALDYIFEEFRRAGNPAAKKFGGTGLGLAIVKKLVVVLGGDIEVESELGKGTKFSIKIPFNFPTTAGQGQ